MCYLKPLRRRSMANHFEREKIGRTQQPPKQQQQRLIAMKPMNEREEKQMMMNEFDVRTMTVYNNNWVEGMGTGCARL